MLAKLLFSIALLTLCLPAQDVGDWAGSYDHPTSGAFTDVDDDGSFVSEFSSGGHDWVLVGEIVWYENVE